MPTPPASKKLRRSEVPRTQDDSILCDDDETDSPYTLYFVKVLDGNPTQLELEKLEETFKVVENNGVMPKWIDHESVDRLQNSDDFFVLPCFRGNFFRKLQAKKMRVYGPPIIMESVNEQKQLSCWDHPVYSSAFEGAIISFTCIDPEKMLELHEKIAWMCGVVEDTLSHETTHLVAGRAEQTEKYKAAINNSIKLMRKEWIEELWETSTTTMGKFSALGKDAIKSYELRVFEGLEMAVTSIDGADRDNLVQLVEQHGGKIPGNMARSRCKHLITDKTNGQKYTKAIEWGTVSVVQTRWVRKCVDLGYLIDEKKYHPKHLSAEHIRSSTPKKDATVTESGPDVSSIAGPGGRLSASSFNLSSAITQMDQSWRQSEYVASSTINNIPSTTKRISRDSRKNRQLILVDMDLVRYKYKKVVDEAIIDQVQCDEDGCGEQIFACTPIAQQTNVNLVRYPTSQSVVNNDVVDDPIDYLRKQIDGRHKELFENCLFHVCGVDENHMDRWRRFLNDTGATRAPKLASATNVVVVSPNQQERVTLREYLQQEDITIVNVQWVVECVKQGEMVPAEGFIWNENFAGEPLFPTAIHLDHGNSEVSRSEPTSREHIFANHTYYVHPEVGETCYPMSVKIEKNGGKLEQIPENAEFVVFGHSALMHKLLAFDTVITDFYIEVCLDNRRLISLSACPLFVPLPRPPLPIFEHRRFVLKKGTKYVQDYAKGIIQANGGVVIEKMDSNSFKIMLGAGSIKDEPEFLERTADFSWIVASVSQCRLQPIEKHRYEENSKPWTNYEREDDVWLKCIRERDSEELNRHYAMHPHFLLSVSNMDQQEASELQVAIRNLGGRIENGFNRDVTHLITSNMQRTPKILSTIAAGRWCLTPEYITKSTAAGRWLSEEPFEWCTDKLQTLSYCRLPKDGESRKIFANLVSICGLWRKRVADMPITGSVKMENRHNGAFTDWRVAIHYEDKKTLQIASILEAGGAVVYSITDYKELSALMPDKVFAYRDFKWNPQSARMLKAEKIPIYTFDVIYEYLIDKDHLNYAKFLHPAYRAV